MADLQWVGIVDNQDTGEEVEAKLTASFAAAETTITAVENQILAINERESVFASLNGQSTPTYSLTTTPTSIDGYSTIGNGNFMSGSTVNGTITPATTGWYRVSFIISMTFTSASVTRTIALNLKNVTDNITIAHSNINIPKDATQDAESLTAIMQLTAGKSYALDISSSVNADVTLDTANFSVELVSY